MSSDRVAGVDQGERSRVAQAEDFYYKVCLIRYAEEALLECYSRGELSGTVHTCIGQEAIAVAVGAVLAKDDIVFSTHRGHGHFLAYGGELEELFAEILARRSQLCNGRGGSQHLHYRNFYSNGIQGGVVGNATGMALAEARQGGQNVVVCFLGDGTLGEGLVYESFNFASLHGLPILYVVEDNAYAQSTPRDVGVKGPIAARAEAFQIATAEIESNDALELLPAFKRALEFVRTQRRPFLQVVHTYRLAAHSKGDDCRPEAEIRSWWQKDPLLLLERQLDAAVVRDAMSRASAAVRTALEAARARVAPEAADLQPCRLTPQVRFPVCWAKDSVPVVQALNRALGTLLESDPRALILGEDIADPYGGAFKVTRGLNSRFPDRVITTPISEAGIVAWGTGAALRGSRTVAEIMFGDFLALAADQLLNHAAKYRWMYNEQVQVPLIVRTPMGGRRGYGPTHSQSIESMFLGIPGLCVVAATHLLDPGEMLLRCCGYIRDPVLFVENKSLYPVPLAVQRDGRLGEFRVRASENCFPTLHLSLTQFQPADATLICYGGSVLLAMEAALTLLVKHEISCDVVIPTLLSPVPSQEICSFLGSSRHVLSLEESPVQGGWGSEILASLVERGGPAQRTYTRIGASFSPLPAGKTLEAHLLPSVSGIVATIRGRRGV